MKLQSGFYRAIPRHAIPIASMIVALVLTLVLCVWSVQIEKAAGKKEFYRIAEKVQVDLANQIQMHLDTIPTLKAFAVLEQHPTDARMAEFIEAISLRQRFPNLTFMFLADRVKHADRDRYVENVRHDDSMFAEGRAKFSIFPQGERDEYLVIRHVSPDVPGTVGYDLYDPTASYRQDVDKAVLTGSRVATGPIVLAHNRNERRNADNTSVVVREAIFENNLVPATTEGRRIKLQGLAGIAFQTRRLIEHILTPEIKARLSLHISDLNSPASVLPLFDNTPPEVRTTKEASDRDQLRLTLPVADRTWVIVAHDRISTAAYWSRPIPIIILGAGSTIALLLWLLMRALVTRTNNAEAAVREALALFQHEHVALEEAQAISAIGSFEWTVKTKVLSWSAEMVRLYGVTAEAFCSDPEALFGRVPNDERDRLRQAIKAVEQEHAPFMIEHRLHHPYGETQILQIRSKWQYDEHGNAQVLTGTAQEISALRKSEAEIIRLAATDALTGLPNRRDLIERLSLVFTQSRRSGLLNALLFIDLDNFKTVNDTKGHAIGDRLLCLVAERIKGLLRAGDTVARIGGDEFVILLVEQAPTVEAAAQSAVITADRVRTAMAEPFDIDGASHLTGASIGVSIFPQGAQNCNDVFREADTAMYRSKATGRNRVTFFAESMQIDIEKKSALEYDLGQAVRHHQLYLVAQTQFDMRGQPCGAELLLRWKHPSGENITPDRFIPLAEETGLILPLGAWVFEQACKTVMQLDAMGRRDTVSINVSPRQFRQPDFVAQVRETLARFKVPPSRLIFEVTEGLLIDDVIETASRMNELSTLGVRFSIDDFGTGYSSLAYLKNLPLYELKIDRTFIHDVLKSENDAAIVRLIIDIATQLNLKVVAEGVETQAQLDFLVHNECNMVQGFLLARPVALQEWIAVTTPRAA